MYVRIVLDLRVYNSWFGHVSVDNDTNKIVTRNTNTMK